MQHSRFVLLLVAGLALTLSASASVQAYQNHYAPVVITVMADTSDPDRVEYIIRVSPWKVVVGADSVGVRWICPTTGIVEDCDITLDGDSGDHFNNHNKEEVGQGTSGQRMQISKNVNADIFKDQSDRGVKKHSVSGTYSIRVFLRSGPVLNIDPDHEIDPRG